jgi:hypothetical protein
MLLYALALLGTLAQAPAPTAVPAALAGADVRLALQATTSYFVAENLCTAPQLLLFSEPISGYRAARLLAPRERALFALPAGLAPSFRLEAFEGGSPLGRSTGAFSLDDLREHGGDAVFGVAAEGGLTLVEVHRGTLAEVSTGPSLYPRIAHVPVPVPSADRRPPTRRIEKRPLPPV